MCGLAFQPPRARSRVTLLARWLWRALDAIDYRMMQARLWVVDALHGPEPETEADRQRGCDREPWRRSDTRQSTE
jgi:hypothetical protein